MQFSGSNIIFSENYEDIQNFYAWIDTCCTVNAKAFISLFNSNVYVMFVNK